MKLIAWQIDNQTEAYTTTRIGGKSQGALDSLNLSFNVNDDPLMVLKNRQLLAKYLNTDLNHMVATRQTHSTHLLKITREMAGAGMYHLDDAFENFDAMYTDERGIFLWSFHADCTPILLYEPKRQLVASIHSRWKGNVNEITLKTLTHLIENERCQPENFYAYIGPSIQYENFEVGQDVIDLVNTMSFDATHLYTNKENGKYLLDGKGLVKAQLLLCGVKEENITLSPYCTIKDNDLFYSHRQNKQCGRNVTMIKLK